MSLLDAALSANELEQLVLKALVGLGDDQPKLKAPRLVDGLAELYIRTDEQLEEALESEGMIAELRLCGIKGRLIPALRHELQRRKATTSVVKIAKGLKDKPWKPPPRLMRRLEVVRCDFAQLSAIDQLSQTFRVRLFLIIKIKGGALDEHLSRDFEGFPVDDDGKPTFRPSAKWYLAQMDFPNGRDITVLESKVTHSLTCAHTHAPDTSMAHGTPSSPSMLPALSHLRLLYFTCSPLLPAHLTDTSRA